jgi:hypothetical protein
MVERAIIADDRGFANHDARAMIDEKVRPIVQAGWISIPVRLLPTS